MEYMVFTLQDHTGSEVIRLQEQPNGSPLIFNSEEELQDFITNHNLTFVHEDFPNLREANSFNTIIRRRLYKTSH